MRENIDTLGLEAAARAVVFPSLPCSFEAPHDSGGASSYEYAALWRGWQEYLCGITLAPGAAFGHGLACVWLRPPVEEAVDAAWAQRPSEGFALHSLALELCMSAVRKLVPEIGERAGCAPLPELRPAEMDALARHGIEFRNMGKKGGTGNAKAVAPVLLRRYAVLTRSPFGGGCGVCALQKGCPGAA